MTPEEYRLEHRRLQELTHRNLMALIDSELSLALTMSELAETEAEVGDEPHAKALLGKVKQDAVRQHIADNVISDGDKREIESRLQELGERLEAAKEQVMR